MAEANLKGYIERVYFGEELIRLMVERRDFLHFLYFFLLYRVHI